MNIKECYQTLGGNYENVLSRLRTEERIEKYILKFLDDHTFSALQESFAEGSMNDAFHAAHTLKGVSENLGFDKLLKSSRLMTEALRSEDIIEATSLLTQVSNDYQLIINSIQEYQNNK